MEETSYSYIIVCRMCARTILAAVDDPSRPEILASNADEIAAYLKQGDKFFLEHIPSEQVKHRIKHGGFCEGHEEIQEQAKGETQARLAL